MPLIRPFAALHPSPLYAQEILAPPYDVLNSDEARLRVEGHPYNFLHVSKPEIDLPVGTEPYSDEVYAKGAENLQQLIKTGILVRDSQPCYYLYGLTMGNHQQIGLVATASVAAYNQGRIRKHELTRPDKEDDRTRHIEVLKAQTGPVFLIYPHHSALDTLVAEWSRRAPFINTIADNGVTHTLWVIDAPEQISTINAIFETIDSLYIADGHHRSAAAARVAKMWQTRNPSHCEEEAYHYFLSVIFPDNQVHILDYNRVIRDLNGLTPSQLLEQLATCFQIQPCDKPAKPQRSGEFGMFLQEQWYLLTIHPDKIPQNDLVAQLDVSLLTEHLLKPILGIVDQRRDKRIDFVGGIRGLQELERRVRSGEMSVAFALYPPSVATLMAVADAGQIMPPKSTWFEPKLADGLVSHLL